MPFPIEFPDIPLAKTRMGLTFNQGLFPGDFSRKVSIHYHAGGKTDRWSGTVTTPVLNRENGNILRAFVSSLQGELGSFTFCDPDHKNPATFSVGSFLADSTLGTADDTLETADSGVFPGNGLVKGANQGGHDLLTHGWPANSSVLKAGDRIQVGTQYFILIEDAATDGFGKANLSLEPAIRVPFADNEPVITSDAKLIGRLQTPVIFFSSGLKHLNPVTLAFEEVL